MIRKNFIERKRVKMHPVKFGCLMAVIGVAVACFTFMTIRLVSSNSGTETARDEDVILGACDETKEPCDEAEKSCDESAEPCSEVEESCDEDNEACGRVGGEFQKDEKNTNFIPVTKAPTSNCSVRYDFLMLINPNFTVDAEFIAARKTELISVAKTYGIQELKTSNGDNLMDAEAAKNLNDMLSAYAAENPGHAMGTRSCFRERGTSCGRLCAATGTSDHHTGLTCDLIDPAYGDELTTNDYAEHPEWQWLKANSYRYGFIDRFPEAWAGGSMSEPANVDENGTTGLFETWHYRFVGVTAATEIATGKYNNGEYDSLEHYLKARGLVTDLKHGLCE